MISARSSAAAKFRIAPWCPRVTSIIYQSLHAARYIHERSETARCAARAPPRRRFEASGRGARFSKTSCFRQTSSSVSGDDHRTSQRSGGRDLRRFRDREFERTAAPRTSPNSPRSVRAAPQDVPRGSRGAAASAYENYFFNYKIQEVRKFRAIGRPIGRSTSEIFYRTGQISADAA